MEKNRKWVENYAFHYNQIHNYIKHYWLNSPITKELYNFSPSHSYFNKKWNLWYLLMGKEHMPIIYTCVTWSISMLEVYLKREKCICWELKNAYYLFLICVILREIALAMWSCLLGHNPLSPLNSWS